VAAVTEIQLEETDDVAVAARLADGAQRLRAELGKVIVGQDDIVEHLLLSLFVGGHSLLVGVPGLAKTLLVHTLASVLDLSF
jgi:MoxR-like ATPase